MAVHLAVAGDVFDGVLFCAVFFPHEMPWMRSGTEFNQFLRIFLLLLLHCETGPALQKVCTWPFVIKLVVSFTLVSDI